MKMLLIPHDVAPCGACRPWIFFINGARAGFFIGDGAGVGKGRTIAGLIWENWHHYRRKAL